MTAIRLLIADDHAIVREGLRTLISTEPDMQLVGEAQDGQEAVALYMTLLPDVLLLDLLMPQFDGLYAIEHILAAHPEACILVLTSFSDEDQVLPAISAGARGYMLKGASHEQLLQAIRDVHSGKSVLHPTITQRLLQKMSQDVSPPAHTYLTERELDVLKLVAQGMTNQDIAAHLSLSNLTVQTHVRNILRKLDLENRTQAALYALKHGIANL